MPYSMEVHDDPTTSPVDAPTQWPLRNFKPLLEELVAISKASKVGYACISPSHEITLPPRPERLYVSLQGKVPFDIDLNPVGEDFSV